MLYRIENNRYSEKANATFYIETFHSSQQDFREFFNTLRNYGKGYEKVKENDI